MPCSRSLGSGLGAVEASAAVHSSHGFHRSYRRPMDRGPSSGQGPWQRATRVPVSANVSASGSRQRLRSANPLRRLGAGVCFLSARLHARAQVGSAGVLAVRRRVCWLMPDDGENRPAGSIPRTEGEVGGITRWGPTIPIFVDAEADQYPPKAPSLQGLVSSHRDTKAKGLVALLSVARQAPAELAVELRLHLEKYSCPLRMWI